MRTKEEILKILKDELPYLREKFNVKSIGLFGSYARDEQRDRSDVDILVEFSKPIGFFKFMELEEYLSKKLGVKVDLVTLDALKPMIKPQIMREVVYV
jgi:predicted nucleotidyltransferase